MPAAGSPAGGEGDGVAEGVGVRVGRDGEELAEVGLAVLLVAGADAAADGDVGPAGLVVGGVARDRAAGLVLAGLLDAADGLRGGHGWSVSGPGSSHSVRQRWSTPA